MRNFSQQKQQAVPCLLFLVSLQMREMCHIPRAPLERTNDIGIRLDDLEITTRKSLFLGQILPARTLDLILRLPFPRLGRCHSLDEVAGRLLRDHPVVSFNGGFRQVVGVQLDQTAAASEAMTAQSTSAGFDAVGSVICA